MEGSSGSAFQNSNSSRALNSSGVSDRNQRLHLEVDPFVCAVEWGDISLRQWLDKPERSVDAFECLHIFRQIVEIVSVAHSQGVVVHNVRPSCFVMSSFNHISFIESASCSDTGSDSLGEGLNNQGGEETEENKMKDRRKDEEVDGKKQSFPMKQILLMEMSWYTSPEEVAGESSSCASDVYRLGVLLFELFCPLSSREEKSRTMSSLRHRVLPPQLLLKWPKEASFCLWLLHPDPSSRPTLGELLQSEFLNEQRDDMEEREAAIELRQRIEDQELLLEFLLLLQQRKQEVAEKLQHTISFLCSDIEEVTKQQTRFKEITGDNQRSNESLLSKSSRLMKNFKKLESAYFLTRCRPAYSSGKLMCREGASAWINPFLEGLCKYLSFSKLRVKADLKQGDLLHSSNLVCSLSFDRDGEFFATAGVNKKIKVFECDAIINEDRDIHYPVVEMGSRSKLSSICWNTYIKSQIASSNFEGVVQLWDVTRSQVLSEMREHERRVWSIDYSSADPTMLASGSDDGSGVSVGTIKTKANVCCVQFPVDSARFLAFGSADHRIYYYDLRNLKMPLCTLVGHNKTVSDIKFVDTVNLVSASTDNTLKLWDLSTCASRVIDSPIQSFTGHMNVKNFVGLSVSDGYIATGSETNEVFIYHKAFPMPALSFKFQNTDPLSGNDVDDAAQFVSSVCWRGQSSTLLAANSTGNVKILEMV
uniref:Protein SPA1-RELATED 3 n=1 Tax=Cajanus cajan TaxID=3821 RepID=A0A151SVN8_CAJCA|nr:Protein SPA1-RELATED 3 [Cajanus cajan]